MPGSIESQPVYLARARHFAPSRPARWEYHERGIPRKCYEKMLIPGDSPRAYIRYLTLGRIPITAKSMKERSAAKVIFHFSGWTAWHGPAVVASGGRANSRRSRRSLSG